jgi:SAM-dependent methyltransferase
MLENPEQANSKPESEKGPRRIFVEIGTSNSPLSWSGQREFKDNEYYLGLDVNIEDLARGKRLNRKFDKLENRSESAKNRILLAADAEKLPFATASADEVFLGDVLNAPGVWGYHTSPRWMLDEIRRVLKPNGKVIIRNIIHDSKIKVGIVTSFLAENNFVVVKVITSGDPDWREQLKVYRREFSTNPHIPDGYLIEATKAEKVQ